jgi:hypothetical protein
MCRPCTSMEAPLVGSAIIVLYPNTNLAPQQLHSLYTTSLSPQLVCWGPQVLRWLFQPPFPTLECIMSWLSQLHLLVSQACTPSRRCGFPSRRCAWHLPFKSLDMVWWNLMLASHFLSLSGRWTIPPEHLVFNIIDFNLTNDAIIGILALHQF